MYVLYKLKWTGVNQADVFMYFRVCLSCVAVATSLPISLSDNIEMRRTRSELGCSPSRNR